MLDDRRLLEVEVDKSNKMSEDLISWLPRFLKGCSGNYGDNKRHFEALVTEKELEYFMNFIACCPYSNDYDASYIEGSRTIKL